MTTNHSQKTDDPHKKISAHSQLNPLQKQVIDKLFRRLIVFLFILFVFSFLDRINIGFAGLTMPGDLGLTHAEFGKSVTFFYIAYVVCGIPANMMLDKIGARRWIAIIMIMWGMASTATMFATGATSLYILRILVGITEAGFLPGMLVYLTYWFPAYYRARANALFMLAMPVTVTFGSLLSGYILTFDGIGGLKGWQWLFLLEGFPSVILGIAVWFYLNDSPKQAKWLSSEEKECLQQMMQADQLTLVQPWGAASQTALQHRSLWRQIFTPVVILYILAYFCLTNTLSTVNIWTPQILQSFNEGSSNLMIGVLAAIPQACTIVLMIVWSRLSDRHQERKHHTALPYLFAAVGWVITALADDNLVQLIGIIIASSASFTAMAIFWTTPDQSISPNARAIGIAVINAVGNIGSGLSPLIVGLLKDSSGTYSSGMYYLAAALIIGAIFVYLIPMRGSRPRATP